MNAAKFKIPAQGCYFTNMIDGEFRGQFLLNYTRHCIKYNAWHLERGIERRALEGAWPEGRGRGENLCI